MNIPYQAKAVVIMDDDKFQRLIEDRQDGVVVNAILAETYPGDKECPPEYEMIMGKGTTYKQARAEAKAYCAKKGYRTFPY